MFFFTFCKYCYYDMFSIVVCFCCVKGTLGIIPVQVRVQKMFSSPGLEIVVVSVVLCVVYSVT